MAHSQGSGGQHQAGHRGQRAEPALAEREQEPQQERNDEIELFLDRQCPGVQQRLFDRRNIEITLAQEKEDVGHHQRRERRRRDEVQVDGAGCQEERRGDRAEQNDDQIERQDAEAALRVEREHREPAARQVRLDLIDDEKARDDEEDIDADKPSRHAGHASVIGDDCQDRYGAQAVDKRQIMKRRRLPPPHRGRVVSAICGESLMRHLRPLRGRSLPPGQAGIRGFALKSKRLVVAQRRHHLLAEQPDRAHQVGLRQVGEVELAHHGVEEAFLGMPCGFSAPPSPASR